MSDEKDTVQPTGVDDRPTTINRALLDQVLDAIRPSLQADGGDFMLVSVDDDEGVVSLQLTGACNGCPLSSITLSMGIESILKEHVPGVKRVQAVVPEGQPDAMGGSVFGSMVSGMGGAGPQPMGVPEDESLI